MSKEIKDMIEPIQDWKVWKYSCTDEEVKRAMTDKSYIEIILGKIVDILKGVYK